MIIKKFTAPTMTEALAKVRDELGAEAIILNTRSNRKGGLFDFAGNSSVEVTAAIDDKSPAKTPAPPKPELKASTPATPFDTKIYSPPMKNAGYEPSDLKKPVDVSMKEIKERMNLENVIEDIKDLKRSIKSLADTALTGEMTGLPPNLAGLLNRMLSSGFDEKMSKRIIRQVLNEMNGGELSDISRIIDRVINLMLVGMGEVSPIIFAGAKPRVVVFVGPTGTGKTTTIAKLATEFTLGMGKNVSILTIDTKRVDAVGQLKSYCRIINIPLHIAYSPDDLPGIMPKLMSSDITLVDTPGLAPLDRPQMIDMVEFLQRLVPQEVHLTMSVTTSLSEMKRIFENFGTTKPNRILFTKLDETDNYGAMFSFAVASKKPLSYVTFGQNVPGDFAIADPEDLLRKSLEKKILI